jgi:hypothetical protein
MGVRPWLVAALALTPLVLAGCSSASDASKAAICTKAVGVLVAAEAGDDAHRRLQEAQDTAGELRSLAGQTSDASLATALRDAAATTGSASADWSPSRLQAWVRQETARFDAVRKACTG